MALTSTRNFGKIGVLMGGPSSERDISLKSGKAVHENLAQIGLNAVCIDIKTDGIEDNARLITSSGIDIAFIALHGHFGEDGQIQAVLEGLGIPYTGSGVKASRLAMDKTASRRIFERSGLAVPKYKEEERSTYGAGWAGLHSDFSFPLVVKPATHGSSIGLSIVEKEEFLDRSVNLALSFDTRIIIEEFIAGRELTVGILGERALPVIEIVPKKGVFDYDAKYHPGMTEYLVPAELEEGLRAMVQAAALDAHKLLGCSGCSRVDLILSGENIPFILEVNTIPGMTATSLLPKAAKVTGMDFPALCVRLIELAYEKGQIKKTSG
ncbi:MAG: D-alanine--D-alanine ligase [Candidatus Omnitrophica bacterium]|nr:D-alanine--D-alanine ligase [Candidatus Omnitrophota bacterium]MDD5552923.1 D-alanine--D-alanine ligase [Candidatus Omnitrophota bacterium]